MSDLLNNPWVITIGAGLIVGLLLRYVFGIGKPAKYSVEELKGMFDKLRDNQTNIGDNPSVIENNIINNLTINNYQKDGQPRPKN